MISEFKQYSLAFEGDIITPADPDFLKGLERWAKNASRQAKFIAFVKSERDISLTLRYAKQASIPIAIRGGGHSCGGASSAEGGVVIDLSRYFRHVTIDRAGDRYPGLSAVSPDELVATVGGGSVWKDVDECTIQVGRATVGGTINHTGCGGLIVGGGYGYLSGRHGLAIDNLLKVRMVIADGSIVEASKDVNPDLFWGVRGGGSNFGVVVSFVLKLHPQNPTVFAGVVSYPSTSVAQVVETMEAYRSRARGPDEAAAYALTPGPDGPVCYCVFFHNGSEKDGRALFKDFFDIEHIGDTTSNVPYDKLNSLRNGFHEPGRCYYISGTVQATAGSSAIQSALKNYLGSAMKAHPHLELTIVMDCFPLEKVLAVRPDEACFSRNPHPSVAVQVAWGENTPENSALARSMAWDVLSLVMNSNAGNPEVTATHEVGYSNFFSDDQTVAEAGTEKAKILFGRGYGRLAQLKKKYDPDMMFTKFFPVVPAP